MLIEIPDEILKTDLSLGKKVMIGLVYTYPNASQSEVANLLGVTTRAVRQAVREAKIAEEQLFLKPERAFLKPEQPFLRSSSSSSKEEKAKPAMPSFSASTPTKEEVAAYAAKVSRPDLAEEFYDHYEERNWLHRGEPLVDWKAMFKGWARKTAKQSSSPRKTTTLEEARYLQDASY